MQKSGQKWTYKKLQNATSATCPVVDRLTPIQNNSKEKTAEKPP